MDKQDSSSSTVGEQDSSSSTVPAFPAHESAYHLFSPVSCGSSVVVYAGKCIPSNSAVAIKVLGSYAQEMMDVWVGRLTALNMTVVSEHPNILKAYCYFAVQSKLWVVMPYILHNSLLSVMTRSFRNGYPTKCIATVLKSVLTALDTIHQKGSSHRGVKPGNILLEENGNVLLSDFAVSSWDYDNEMSYDDPNSPSSKFPYVHTRPYWVPPEALGYWEPSTTLKFDIWSIGITALELYHGLRPPISEFPKAERVAGKLWKRFQFPKDYEKGKRNANSCPPALRDFIDVCLAQDPSNRPSVKELLKHSFLRDSKSSGYLYMKLLRELSASERRGETLLTPKTPTISETGNSSGNEAIVNWKFNSTTMQLDPIYREIESESVTCSSSDTSTDQLEKRLDYVMALREKIEEKEKTEQREKTEASTEKTEASTTEAASIEELQRRLRGGAEQSRKS